MNGVLTGRRTIRRLMNCALIAACLFGVESAAQAQDDPPLCSDRPGNATPTCVVAPGTFQVETSAVDWTLDQGDGTREDTVLIGDTLLKYGIGAGTELHLAFTPYTHDRTRAPGGNVSIADGFGEVQIAARSQVITGDFSLSVQPYVVVPVGSDEVSDGTWSAGVQLPVGLSLPQGWSLAGTAAVAASADSDGDGRHLFYAGVAAVTKDLGHGVNATGEVYVARDRDPSGFTTPVTADALIAWQPSTDWQFDASAYLGLNADAPDLELLFGFTRRFR